VYAGGLRGRSVASTVEVGKSTVLALKKEDVGAVDFVVDPDVCAESTHLSIAGVERTGSTTTRRSVVALMTPVGDCSQTIAGLKPGEYEGAFTGRSTGFLVVEPFSIAAQAVSQVRITAPMVRLFGRVLINGKAPEDLAVQFEPVASVGQGPMSTVQALPDGTFEVRLPKPGRYQATVSSRRLPLLGVQRVVSVDAGANTLDWSIHGGFLTVSIDNWDKSSSVELNITRVGPLEQGHAMSVEFAVHPDDLLPLKFDGIGLGHYEVDARQKPVTGTMRVSPRVRVDLDQDHSSYEVKLRLEEYSAIIAVHDRFGVPIAGTQVLAGTVGLKEVEPGKFAIDGDTAVPLDPVLVRASGYSPTCRLAPMPGQTSEVVLDPGVAATVEFRGRGDVTDAPGRLIWPGTDCPVELRQFERAVVSADPQKQRYVFSFPHFPRANAIQFEATRFLPPQPVQVGPDGVLRIMLPAEK
jgi:hypothetical protein